MDKKSAIKKIPDTPTPEIFLESWLFNDTVINDNKINNEPKLHISLRDLFNSDFESWCENFRQRAALTTNFDTFIWNNLSVSGVNIKYGERFSNGCKGLGIGLHEIRGYESAINGENPFMDEIKVPGMGVKADCISNDLFSFMIGYYNSMRDNFVINFECNRNKIRDNKEDTENEKKSIHLYSMPNSNIIASEGARSDSIKNEKITDLHYELNIISFQNDLEKVECEKMNDYLNRHLRSYIRKGGNEKKWIEKTKKYMPSKFDEIQKDAFLTWIENIERNNQIVDKKEEQQPITAPLKSKLNFTGEKLKSFILELALLKGYEKPSTYLDELLLEVKRHNDFELECNFYLNVHYLCKENESKFWNEGHKKGITQWLKNSRVVTDVFDTTWNKMSAVQISHIPKNECKPVVASYALVHVFWSKYDETKTITKTNWTIWSKKYQCSHNTLHESFKEQLQKKSREPDKNKCDQKKYLKPFFRRFEDAVKILKDVCPKAFEDAQKELNFLKNQYEDYLN